MFMPEFQTLADNGWCFSSLSFCSLKQFVAVVKATTYPPPQVAMETCLDILKLKHSPTLWYHQNFLEMF